MTRSAVRRCAFHVWLTLALLAACQVYCCAAEEPGPRHLLLAQAIAKEIKPEKNLYSHKDMFIKWKDGAGTEYENRTDCSGFLNLLLEKAYGYSHEDLQRWTGRARPLAKTWHHTVAEAKGFQRIETVQALQPGDVLAIRYEAGAKNTGHVMLVAGSAAEREVKKPLVAGTRQWEVPVLDSSSSPHGPQDSRRIDAAKHATGVGTGVLRIYTDDKGAFAGYAWSSFANSEFRAVKERPMAAGRLIADYKPAAPNASAPDEAEKTEANDGD